MIKNKSLLAVVMAAHRNGGALSSRRMSFVDLAVLHVWRGAGYVSFYPMSQGLAKATGADYQITSVSREALADSEEAQEVDAIRPVLRPVYVSAKHEVAQVYENGVHPPRAKRAA
jgi:hypothetical protein